MRLLLFIFVCLVGIGAISVIAAILENSFGTKRDCAKCGMPFNRCSACDGLGD